MYVELFFSSLCIKKARTESVQVQTTLGVTTKVQFCSDGDEKIPIHNIHFWPVFFHNVMHVSISVNVLLRDCKDMKCMVISL